MNCPICNIGLVMTDKQGVEIDYCPKCRGIWLDRGELEKIIERTFAANLPPQPGFGNSYHDSHKNWDHEDHDHPDHDDHRYSGNHRQPRKRNFLSDIFDF